MRSMALLSACGGCNWRAENNCRSGSRSSSSSISAPGLRLMWPPSGRICAAQLLDQPPRAAAQIGRTGPACRAPRRSARSRACRRGSAVARLLQRAAQIAHLPRQAADEAAVEARVGILQDERRLAEPAQDAARENVGAPAERMPAALQVDPVVDQRAGIGAGDRASRRRADGAARRSSAASPPIRRTAASSRTASGGRRSRPCRRRRSGRRRFRWRGWRRRCAGPAARSPGGRSWPSRSASAAADAR